MRTRLQSSVGEPVAETVNLIAIAGEVIDDFHNPPPGVDLHVPPQSLQISGDPALIKILVQNLIDNALKFSLPDSEPVAVTLGQGEEGIEIIVDDDGPGIPADQVEKVFEPFVKLNPARGHRSGYGLGLNLCHRIVQASGWAIEIQPRQPRGTRVLVRFPDS
jgi:signal transduction histidine kinase